MGSRFDKEFAYIDLNLIQDEWGFKLVLLMLSVYEFVSRGVWEALHGDLRYQLSFWWLAAAFLCGPTQPSMSP